MSMLQGMEFTLPHSGSSQTSLLGAHAQACWTGGGQNRRLDTRRTCNVLFGDKKKEKEKKRKVGYWKFANG